MALVNKEISIEQNQRNKIQSVLDLCVTPKTNAELLSAVVISDCALLLITNGLVHFGFMTKDSRYRKECEKGGKRYVYQTINHKVLDDADFANITTKASSPSGTPAIIKKRVVSSDINGVKTVNMDDKYYADKLTQTRVLERSERRIGKTFVSGSSLSAAV